MLLVLVPNVSVHHPPCWVPGTGQSLLTAHPGCFPVDLSGISDIIRSSAHLWCPGLVDSLPLRSPGPPAAPRGGDDLRNANQPCCWPRLLPSHPMPDRLSQKGLALRLSCREARSVLLASGNISSSLVRMTYRRVVVVHASWVPVVVPFSPEPPPPDKATTIPSLSCLHLTLPQPLPRASPFRSQRYLAPPRPRIPASSVAPRLGGRLPAQLQGPTHLLPPQSSALAPAHEPPLVHPACSVPSVPPLPSYTPALWPSTLLAW